MSQGIRVNSVSPAAIETPMFDRFPDAMGTDARRQITAMHPIGRTGRPEEIAAAVLWCAPNKRLSLLASRWRWTEAGQRNDFASQFSRSFHEPERLRARSRPGVSLK